MSVRAVRGWHWCGCVAMLLAAATAQGQPSAGVSAEEIEARVRQIYIEGYPSDGAANLSREAIDRLGEMLSDPAEQAYWSNVVLALGASESRQAHPLLADFASRVPTGEVSADLYSAHVALRIALGQLAHTNRESLELLSDMARDTRGDPGWHFQSLHGPRLTGALKRSAITGLAVSGRAEATAVFDEIEATAGPTGELSRHLQSARSVHEKSAGAGPGSVLQRVDP